MSQWASSGTENTTAHASGEKCATALPTEIQVGKATPIKPKKKGGKTGGTINQSLSLKRRKESAPLVTLTPLTGLLYTAPVPCSRSLSPSTHRSITFAPSTVNSMIFLITSRAMSAATYSNIFKKGEKLKSFVGKKRKGLNIHIQYARS
jgi:hypothetical protein